MDLSLLKEVAEQLIPFNRYLGVQMEALEPGRVVLTIPWRDEFVGDPMRPAMHGGVISTLADTAGGFAVWSAVKGSQHRVSTVDLRVDYLHPGGLEALTAVATIARVGASIGVADIRLYHPARPDRTVATGKGVYAIRVPKPALDKRESVNAVMDPSIQSR